MVSHNLQFSSLKKRIVQANFSGGHISSDSGLLLLREIDKTLKLSDQLAECFDDPRRQSHVQHDLKSMIQQRLMALAAGYEDLNDHDHFRHDYALQTVLDRDQPLASSPTLHRMEACAQRQSCVKAHQILWQQFVQSFSAPPKQIILDLDASDIPVHGDQPDKFFHGYYDHYCYLPLYVFADRFPLVTYLRPSDKDGAYHCAAILRLLVSFLRQHWSDVQIIFRGDSGFCRQPILRYCERYKVDYIVGIARNKRLERTINNGISLLKQIHQLKRELNQTGQTREYWDFLYRAGSWHRPRKVIAKLEITDKGANPRFLLTTLKGDAKDLYQLDYCACGEMENRIKDQQLDLFGKRTSSKHWWSNQWRLLLSAYVFLLFEHLRLQLDDPVFKRMSVNNLRLKLIKVAAVIIRNTRRVQFYLSEAYSYQDIFRRLVQSLV